jgi:hypothetical protein
MRRLARGGERDKVFFIPEQQSFQTESIAALGIYEA